MCDFKDDLIKILLSWGEMPGCPCQVVTWGKGQNFRLEAFVSYAQAQAALLSSGHPYTVTIEKQITPLPGFPTILLESKTPGSPLLPGSVGASWQGLPHCPWGGGMLR